MSWRDTLQVHPACAMFEPLTGDDLRALGEDILKNGMTSPIVLWQADRRVPLQLLDGQSRCDAIELATGCEVIVGPPSITAGDFLACDKVVVLGPPVDPWAYVASANLHRRHLTAEKKREVVAALLKANPKRSNNATAKIAKVDDKTVGAVRAELERRSEIPNVSTRTDSKGRQQPAKKPPTRAEGGDVGRIPHIAAEAEADRIARRLLAQFDKAPEAAQQQFLKTAPLSAEIARIKADNDDLRNRVRMLEFKIRGYESENASSKI